MYFIQKVFHRFIIIVFLLVKVVHMKLDIHITKVVIKEGELVIMKELLIIGVEIQEGLFAFTVMSLDIQNTLVENCRIELRNLSQHILQSPTLQMKRPL